MGITAFAANVRDVALFQRRHGKSGRPAKYERFQTRCDALKQEEEPDGHMRRSVLTGGLALLSIGLIDRADAASGTKYYEELLEKSKKPDTSMLLENYEKVKDGPKRLDKRGKNLRSKKSGKGVSNSPGTKRAVKTPGTLPFNPVEVGFGLLGLAGAVVIGRQSSKKKGSAESPKLRTSRRQPVAKPSRKPSLKQQKTIAKQQRGTVKLSPTKNKDTPKTQARSPTGTVARAKTKSSQIKEPSEASSSLPAFGGAAVVAVLAAVFIFGTGSSPKSDNTPIIKDETKVEVIDQIDNKANDIKELNDAKLAPAISAPSDQEKASPSALPSKPTRVPTPTTGNSPIVLVGGSIATLIVAAALGGGSGENVSSSQSEDKQENGAAEARAWIEAWRKKQSTSDTPKARAAEARAWIEAWRSKQK